MTRGEAIKLETACDKLFGEVGIDAQVCMALNGKLKVEFYGRFQTNYITFELTGEPQYICFRGYVEYLYRAISIIKSVCADEENRKMLERLKWSYEHIDELTEA